MISWFSGEKKSPVQKAGDKVRGSFERIVESSSDDKIIKSFPGLAVAIH
jgi:hypothetical protein